MRIVIQNDFGKFEIGGGRDKKARLITIEGIGIPAKDDTTIVFEGQAGKTVTGSRDLERVITMSLDFSGDECEVEKLYRIIHKPVEILFFLGNRRRMIRGRCTTATDITGIIYHRLQSAVLQFVCYNPYFLDFNKTVKAISANEDQFPNTNMDGKWYVELPAKATLRSSKASIYNYGDVEIYPLITLQNNKTIDTLSDNSSITLSNLTTGKDVILEYQMSAGENVIIDLENRAITSDINGSIVSCISDDTVLSDFYLEVGKNDIVIEAGSAENIFAVAHYFNQYVSVVI